MARPGRPKKVHDQAKREFCMLVSVGLTRAVAAEFLGLSLRAVQYEMRRSREFRASIRRADMEAETIPLASLRVASRSSWRAAAWYLERVRPIRYARQKLQGYSRAQLDSIVYMLIAYFVDRIQDRAVRLQLMEGANELFNRWKRREEIEGVGPSKKNTGPLFDDLPHDAP